MPMLRALRLSLIGLLLIQEVPPSWAAVRAGPPPPAFGVDDFSRAALMPRLAAILQWGRRPNTHRFVHDLMPAFAASAHSSAPFHDPAIDGMGFPLRGHDARFMSGPRPRSVPRVATALDAAPEQIEAGLWQSIPPEDQRYISERFPGEEVRAISLMGDPLLDIGRRRLIEFAVAYSLPIPDLADLLHFSESARVDVPFEESFPEEMWSVVLWHYGEPAGLHRAILKAFREIYRLARQRLLPADIRWRGDPQVLENLYQNPSTAIGVRELPLIYRTDAQLVKLARASHDESVSLANAHRFYEAWANNILQLIHKPAPIAADRFAGPYIQPADIEATLVHEYRGHLWTHGPSWTFNVWLTHPMLLKEIQAIADLERAQRKRQGQWHSYHQEDYLRIQTQLQKGRLLIGSALYAAGENGKSAEVHWVQRWLRIGSFRAARQALSGTEWNGFQQHFRSLDALLEQALRSHLQTAGYWTVTAPAGHKWFSRTAFTLSAETIDRLNGVYQRAGYQLWRQKDQLVWQKNLIPPPAPARPFAWNAASARAFFIHVEFLFIAAATVAAIHLDAVRSVAQGQIMSETVIFAVSSLSLIVLLPVLAVAFHDAHYGPILQATTYPLAPDRPSEWTYMVTGRRLRDAEDVLTQLETWDRLRHPRRSRSAVRDRHRMLWLTRVAFEELRHRDGQGEFRAKLGAIWDAYRWAARRRWMPADRLREELRLLIDYSIDPQAHGGSWRRAQKERVFDRRRRHRALFRRAV